MTDLLGLPVPFLLLLPLALALGVDLFLTLLIVTASLDLGWNGPAGVQGAPLRWGVMAVLTLLYLLEGGLELRALPALIWHNVQLALRPLAAALLAITLLGGQPLPLILSGILLAAAVAAFSHVLSWGEKLSQHLLSSRRVSPLTHTLLEDTLVLAFTLTAMGNPSGAFLVSGGILVLGILGGGSHHHLTRFGIALFSDRVWGLVSPARWVEGPKLPGWVARGWKDAELSGVRGLRSGVRRLPGIRGFRDGWFLDSGGASSFAFRGLRKPRVVSLAEFQMFPPESSSIALRVPLKGSDGSESALFLQRGAPGPKSHKLPENL